MKDLQVGLLIDIYGACLTERQLDMLSDYFFFDLSLAEIAQNHSLSRATVHQHITEGRRLLFDLEARLGIADKLARAKQQLADKDAKTLDTIFFGDK